MLKAAEDEYYRWDAFNGEMLERMFTTPKFAKEYRFWGIAVSHAGQPFSEDLREFLDHLSDKIQRLASIRDRLPLIPVSPNVVQPVSPIVFQAEKQMEKSVSKNGRVFIVHGHDTEVRESVARFLEQLGLEVVILREQPGRGRTIIEKFEDHSNVDFAVVLLTPDDVGAASGARDNLQPRARQNVILELGYFVGKLKREKVCALYVEGVELPSDMRGVQYIEYKGEWKSELARELRAAKLDIDMNKV